MCLSNNKDLGSIEISKKNITVYKVFIKIKNLRCLIFRTISGYSDTDDIATEYRSINSIIEKKSSRFDDGFGYHCFGSLGKAERYMEKLIPYKNNLMIQKMVIPRRTKYSRGLISNNFFGAGLPAIRTDRLKLPRGEKRDLE